MDEDDDMDDQIDEVSEIREDSPTNLPSVTEVTDGSMLRGELVITPIATQLVTEEDIDDQSPTSTPNNRGS